MKSIRPNGRPFGPCTVQVLKALVLNQALSSNQLRQVMRRIGVKPHAMEQKLRTLAGTGHIERTPETADRGAYVIWQITATARARLVAQEGPPSTWAPMPEVTAPRWGKRKASQPIPRRRRFPAEPEPAPTAPASVWAYAAQQ